MATEAVRLAVLILATFRISYVIKYEKIGAPVRKWMGENEMETVAGDNRYPTLTTYDDTFLGNMLQCFYCLNFWVSVISLVVWHVAPVLLYPFALNQLNKWMHDYGES